MFCFVNYVLVNKRIHWVNKMSQYISEITTRFLFLVSVLILFIKSNKQRLWKAAWWIVSNGIHEWTYLIETYSICHIHIALHHVQQILNLVIRNNFINMFHEFIEQTSYFHKVKYFKLLPSCKSVNPLHKYYTTRVLECKRKHY